MSINLNVDITIKLYFFKHLKPGYWHNQVSWIFSFVQKERRTKWISQSYLERDKKEKGQKHDDDDAMASSQLLFRLALSGLSVAISLSYFSVNLAYIKVFSFLFQGKYVC